jgi:hypothetical protein
MTLNITVVGANGIHQSADFRLVDFKAGLDGKWIPLQGSSPKLITLRYKDWAGYLTYCGIGLWDYKPTYTSAAEWIVSLGQNPTFDDVVRILETRGSEWIKHIQNRSDEFQSHSFILAAYELGLPRVTIVSNTHSTEGKFSKPEVGRLRSSVGGGGAGTHVYVTGVDYTVPNEDRIAIRRMSEETVPAIDLRNRLATINANAANRSENRISVSCLCYSLDSLGRGAGEIHGEVTGPLIPILISHGIDYSKAIAQLGQQLVQVAFTPGSKARHKKAPED